MFGGFIGGYIVGLIFCIPIAFILLYLIATGLLSFAGSHIVFFTVLICGWIVIKACKKKKAVPPPARAKPMKNVTPTACPVQRNPIITEAPRTMQAMPIKEENTVSVKEPKITVEECVMGNKITWKHSVPCHKEKVYNEK